MEIFLDLLPALVSVVGFVVLFLLKNRGVRIPKDLSSAFTALILSYVKEKPVEEHKEGSEDNSALLADFLALVKKYGSHDD